MSNTINFKGKEYPIRTVLALIDGVEYELTIATESLSSAMDIESDVEATDLDETIYFYIADELIDLSAKEIVEEHLDEPLIFIEEIN